MVKLVVHGDTRALCTQRVMILLEELQLKYTVQEVDLLLGEHKSDEFLKLNPFGKVPVVEYGDKALIESRSILRYISRNNVDVVDLWLRGNVNVDMWLEVEAQELNPHISKIVYEKMFRKSDANDNHDTEAIVSKSLNELEKVLDVYEARLSENEYLGGSEYSIADISNVPYMYAFIKCGFKDVLKKRPHVYGWLKRVIKRPAVHGVLHQSKIE